jgi:hypothetical protein
MEAPRYSWDVEVNGDVEAPRNSATVGGGRLAIMVSNLENDRLRRELQEIRHI